MLIVEGLTRTFGDFSVSFDLSVGSGETLALVGPSGSGKTTALNLIAGLTQSEAGRVVIDGEDVTQLPPWKRNISMVFQDLALFPHLDVGGNIAYGLFIRKVPRAERQRIVRETLDTVRLAGYAARKIHTLSGGERQRVAIARALALNPRALLLDEPFSSLDAPLRKSLRREFLEIRARSPVPCVFVTHDRDEALMLGTHTALMEAGRITETGKGREILLAPKTENAARFFGAGEVLPCRILRKNERGAEVDSPLGPLTIPATPPPPPDPLLFVPHDALSLEDRDGSPGWKPFTARSEGALFEGRGLTLKLLLSPSGRERPVLFELTPAPGTAAPESGSPVRLWVDENRTRLVAPDTH